jgi:uncharacterized membrane protein SpoIIM required for sporulation
MLNLGDDDNKARWRRLEELLGKLGTGSLSRLSKAEVRELGDLYRRAASDLAIAREESRDPVLINYLNSLTIRAHGEIYRAESGGARVARRFFAQEFPQAFRRQWRFIFAAFAVFTTCFAAAFFLGYRDPSFASAIDAEAVVAMAESDTRWWERLNEANQIGSTSILTNNINVALKAFAYGVFFGIGTLWVLVMNGLSIGGVVGICYAADPEFGNALVTFMVAHGVVELSCIFIAGGAGMRLGYSLIDPGDMTRAEALKKNGLEAVRLAVGCAVLLFGAGLIEGFVSPSAMHPAFKYGTGAVTGIAMFSYLILSGRTLQSSPESSQ